MRRGLILVIIVLIANAAQAQRAGSVTGVIRDATGLPLSGVVVTLDGTRPISFATGPDGTFQFTDVPAGDYRFTASFPGFVTERRTIRLAVDRTETLVITMSVQWMEQAIVTASRLGEADVQTTALAVSVLPSQELDRVQAHSIAQLAGMAPSVTFSQNSDFAQLTIRGIGSNVVFAGSDPSSAVYVDGVYLARPVMVNTDFIDLDRVEILRGPQGTLYGRNAVGGAINLVTRPPSDEFDGTVDLSAGNYGTLRTHARVGGPIVKGRLLGTVSFVRGIRSGFVHDLDHPDHSLGGEDVTAGRGQLRVLMSPRLDLLFSADATTQDPVPLTYAKVLAVKPGFVVDNPSRLHEVRTSTLATSRISQRGASVRVTFSPASGPTVASLSAFRMLDYDLLSDADITELALVTSQVRERQHQLSQEITIALERRHWNWIAGLYWFDENDRQPTVVGLGGPGLATLLDPHVEASSRAVFGQGSLAVAPRVRATAGIRFSNEEKTIWNGGRTWLTASPDTTVAGSTYSYTDSIAYTAWTPKLGVEVRPAGEHLLFASATRGFKSGGFNLSSRLPGLGYAPEWAWSYEAGFKMRLGRRQALLNASVFHTDYTDLQVQTAIRPGLLDISNAAAATVRGVEIESTVGIAASIRAGGHLSWLAAAYERYLAVGTSGLTSDAAGRRLNNAPLWSGRLWVEWNPSLARTMLSLRAESRGQSVVFFTPFNDHVQRQPAYGVLEFSAQVGPPGRGWSVTAFGRNLTNTGYITGTFASPPPAIGGRPGEPRQIGVRLALSRVPR